MDVPLKAHINVQHTDQISRRCQAEHIVSRDSKGFSFPEYFVGSWDMPHALKSVVAKCVSNERTRKHLGGARTGTFCSIIHPSANVIAPWSAKHYLTTPQTFPFWYSDRPRRGHVRAPRNTSFTNSHTQLKTSP